MGNDLCFRLGEKMFRLTCADLLQGGLSLKGMLETSAELIEREGMDPAVYIGRYK